MNPDRIFRVLKGPVISEKSTRLAESAKPQIVFKVATDATKLEIKKAVEQFFKVEVQGVTVINIKGKIRRYKQQVGRRKDWKKAYVTLKAGQDINFAGAE